MRYCAGLLALALIAAGIAADGAAASPSADSRPGPEEIAERFLTEVRPRLQPPPDVAATYARRVEETLRRHASSRVDESPDPRQQYYLLIDRSPRVQAALLFWGEPSGTWRLIGASPVSTGRPGRYDHFITPVGAYAHTLANPDFRSEGTRNARGVRGYGERGMRVYDFGWAEAERGWGRGGRSLIRLQMHATDPVLLEPSLGESASKGCVRISAAFNTFIDRYGLLDADYEEALARGAHLWVMRPDRQPAAGPGRWLVIVDSASEARPAWSPRPGRKSVATGTGKSC